MKLKKRVFEEVEIPTNQKEIKSNLNENNIYYITSKTIEAKGTNESVSLFANITYMNDIKTKNENTTSVLPIKKSIDDAEESITLDAPPKKSPLEFTVGTDEVFNNVDDKEEHEEHENEFNENTLSITFYIELEGVFYKVNEYEYNIPFENFEPLLETFNKKNSLDADVFFKLISNECKLSDLFYEKSEVEDFFKKGNIDLSINEIFNNRETCLIDNITITKDHANIVLKRFEGNQIIFYKLDSTISVNESLYNCMDLFTSSQTSLNEFVKNFSLEQTN